MRLQNPMAVAGVLRFLYTGDVEDTDITQQCLPDLLIITDQWQLKDMLGVLLTKFKQLLTVDKACLFLL